VGITKLYSELTRGDTFNHDIYTSGDEYYPVFEIGRDVVGRFTGSIDEYLGPDHDDYFVIDLAGSGLKAGDTLLVTLTAASGSDLSIRWGGYGYEFLDAYGPDYQYHFLSNEKTYGKITIPEGVDVISFQVYSYSDVSSTYNIDLMHTGRLLPKLKFMGVGERPELFRLSDAIEPVEIVAGNGNDFAWTGKADDIIYCGFGRDIAVGLDGNDLIYGFNKSDISGLKAGDNTSSASNPGAKDGADQLLGGRGNDKIYGGAGGDYIHGEWDNDTLYGQDGNDLMYGGYGADVMNGGRGNDVMYGGSETKPRGDWFGEALTLTWDGTTGKVMTPQAWTIAGEAQADDKSNDRMSGGDGNDRMWGQGGNDKLYGGLGKDFLVGGSGKDTFVFDTKLGSKNIDTIDDFSVKDDTIFVDRTIFTKVGKIGDLSSQSFYIGAKAHDASDRIIYDKATGKLWYDADGSGNATAIQFAVLDKSLKLTASDFDIIS
jgi:Ca2+-binding RTX toxin-like protein